MAAARSGSDVRQSPRRAVGTPSSPSTGTYTRLQHFDKPQTSDITGALASQG